MQYALRALMYLGTLPEDETIPVRQLAQMIDVPEPVLSKVIQNLARHRLVKTVKGPGGGVLLAQPPEEVKLLEVLNVVGGPELFGSTQRKVSHLRNEK